MPFKTTSDPNFVADEQGRIVPADSVDPSDIVSDTASTPAPSATGSPVDNIMASLDHPDIQAYTAPKGMVRSGVSVQRGVPEDTLNSMVDQNNTNASVESGAVQEAARRKTESLTKVNDAESTRTGELIADARQEEVKNRKQAEQSDLQELALRDQKDPSIDPDQFMRDNGLGMVFLAALTGALGAVRKDNGQGTQDILKVIDGRINQNIAKQKGEIESGRIRRGNLIDYYHKHGLDARQAEAAAKALYYAQGDRYLQLERERASIPDIQSNADILSTQIQSKASQYNQQLTLLGTDKVSESYAPPKPKAKVDVAGVLKKASETDQVLEKGGSSIEVRKAAWSAAAPGVPFPTNKSEYKVGQEEKATKLETEKNKKNEDQGKAQAAWDSIDSYGKSLGFQTDPEHEDLYRIPSGVSGNLNLKAGVENLKGTFGEAKPIEAARRVAVEALGRLASGGVIGKDELPGFKAMIGEGMSLKQIAANLNAIRSFIAPRMKDFHEPTGEETTTASTPKSWE